MEIRKIWRYSVRIVSRDLPVDNRKGGVTALMLGWEYAIGFYGRGIRE